jgi:hypothetical protein
VWLEEEPALEVQVENEAERGLLGVTILKDDTCSKKYPVVIALRRSQQIMKVVYLGFFFILLKNQKMKINSISEIKYLV